MALQWSRDRGRWSYDSRRIPSLAARRPADELAGRRSCPRACRGGRKPRSARPARAGRSALTWPHGGLGSATRRAGPEFEEKLPTSAMVALPDRAERRQLRVPHRRIAVRVNALTAVPTSVFPGRRGPSGRKLGVLLPPPQARPGCKLPWLTSSAPRGREWPRRANQTSQRHRVQLLGGAGRSRWAVVLPNWLGGAVNRTRHGRRVPLLAH